MQIGYDGHNFEWIEDWARIPDSVSTREGWAHHGVVVTGDGDIVASHPGDPEERAARRLHSCGHARVEDAADLYPGCGGAVEG